MQDPGRGQVVVVVLKKRVLDVEQVVVQVQVQMTVQAQLQQVQVREHPNVVQRAEGVPSSVSAFDST